MAAKVVDTSAVAALLFGGPEADAIAARLEGASLAAPALMDFELANVCLVKMRRYPEQRSALWAAFKMRTKLGIESAPVEYESVLDVAHSTGLTVYDASYLWLATQLGAELVTLDRKLANASAPPAETRPQP